jgi:hypothetical protein
VTQNTLSGTFIGLCIQTPGAQLTYNDVSSTCIGAYVDPYVQGPKLSNNKVSSSAAACNTKDNPVGVYGILAAGSLNAKINDNSVTGISTGGFTGLYSAGIAVVDDPTQSPPAVASGNKVVHNTVQGNDIDVLLASNGTGNVFKSNTCGSSFPAGLCSS